MRNNIVESLYARALNESASVTVDDWLNLYQKYYDEFYEKDPAHYRALVYAGDALLKQESELVKELAEYRGDAFISDRELAALVCSLTDLRIV